MSTKLFLTFATVGGRDPQEVEWHVRDTALGRKWVGALAEAMACSHRVREQRFSGWANRQKDLAALVSNLNATIATINLFYKSDYVITERAKVGMGQPVLNALHHHFELLLGQSWRPSKLTLGVPRSVQLAVRLLNDHVHDYEYAARAADQEARGEYVSRAFHFQFVPFAQRELTLEDLKSFSFVSEPGDLVTNYCQLGKTWCEVFQDRDEHIHASNIAPLRYYAPAFSAFFFKNAQWQSDKMIADIRHFMKFRAAAAKETINVMNPRHALGCAVYAQLAPGSFFGRCTEAERDAWIRDHSNVCAIRLESGGQELSRSFPRAHSYLEIDASPEVHRRVRQGYTSKAAPPWPPRRHDLLGQVRKLSGLIRG